MKYYIELVWNREFHWSFYGKLHDNFESARKSAIDIRDSGDGDRVKKVRVLNNESGEIVWNG